MMVGEVELVQIAEPAYCESAKEEKKMRNCKVGDLAVVVKDTGKMENLGLIVRIVNDCGPVNWVEMISVDGKSPERVVTSLNSWHVEVVSDNAQIIYLDEIEGVLYGERTGDIPDAFLRRLPDLFEEDFKDRKVLDLQNLPFDPAIEAVRESYRLTGDTLDI
jgi:hypothetical protein